MKSSRRSIDCSSLSRYRTHHTFHKVSIAIWSSWLTLWPRGRLCCPPVSTDRRKHRRCLVRFTFKSCQFLRLLRAQIGCYPNQILFCPQDCSTAQVPSSIVFSLWYSKLTSSTAARSNTRSAPHPPRSGRNPRTHLRPWRFQ